jgi:hypothetical protein
MTKAVVGEIKIFLLSHGEVKEVTSIFIASPNKGEVTKCTNNCRIALFPHAIKIHLRIIQIKLHLCIGYETPMESAGLRKVCEAREQVANVSESWTAQGRTTKISNNFIDYTKDFDSVLHLKKWKNIRSVGIPKQLTVLI